MAWRCGLRPLVPADAAAFSPRRDVVENCRARPAHRSIRAGGELPGAGPGTAPAPAAAFAGFSEAAQLMGSTAVTSTGVPQNANPLLAPSRTIHVGNLSPGASPAVLRQIFECIGGVRDVRVAGDGRYGFVDFLDAAAAEAAVAMNGTMVCGAALRVEKAMQPRLFAQSNQPTPLPPAGARDPAAALLAFRATQAAALRAGEAGGPAPGAGLAGVTSPAVLAALARAGAGGGAPAPPAGPDPALAFLNPAQQRAAREAAVPPVGAADAPQSLGGAGGVPLGGEVVRALRDDPHDAQQERKRGGGGEQQDAPALSRQDGPREPRADDGPQRPEDLDGDEPLPAVAGGEELHEERERGRDAAQPESHQRPREEQEPEARRQRAHETGDEGDDRGGEKRDASPARVGDDAPEGRAEEHPHENHARQSALLLSLIHI